MISSEQAHSRERLAWALLIASFFVCALFCVAVPAAGSTFVQNTTQALTTSIQANQGAVRIEDARGLRRAVLAGEPEQTAEPMSTILTDSTDTALMTVTTPDQGQLLARLQLYSNSAVTIEQATAPRFELSSAALKVNLALRRGRLRLTLPEANGRPLELNLDTPQAAIVMRQPGLYSLEVSGENTLVSVQEGEAFIESGGGQLSLQPDQRAEIAQEQSPIGPLDPERNLIQNETFNNGLTNWSLFTWNVELADQPAGLAEVRESHGEKVLQIAREGVGHADVRVQQTINQDVADFDSLRLLLSFQINNQTLGVCGVQGSECPLMARVNFVDENGTARTWQHGFYAFGQIDDNATPGACISCAVVQTGHEAVPMGEVYFYDVDISAELARQGVLPPRYIENVVLVASGHTFDVEIVDVSLIVEE